MSEDEDNPTPLPPPLPSLGELPPPPPPMPISGDIPPPPPMPEMMAPPPMPEMPAPPPMPEMPAPPPMPEMPAPPPMPEMPAPPPMPEMMAPPPMPEMPAPPPMPEMPTPSPMPEVEPVVSSEHQSTEDVELPDPMAALDLLSSSPPSIPVDDIGLEHPSNIDDSSTELDTNTNDSEPNVADYKWKDSVLDAILDKFEITDRDAFLVHATAFDANKNMYLTKNELTDAAKEWVEISRPISELQPLDDTIDPVETITEIEPALVSEENTQAILPPLELPPLPEEPPLPTPPPMELPPLPEELPLAPPPAMELPPLPVPAPAPEATVEVQPVTPTPTESEPEKPQTEDYRELWKRRSDKSLPQMYGAIDRIGDREIGSLLDRYSDRFGHELDREIIVMRRAEQDARREAVPVVELISAPDSDDESDESPLTAQLSEVEDILRPLQISYKSTDDKSEKKRLAPALKSLIAERKILLSVISGESEEDALDGIPERPEIPDISHDSEEINDDETDEFDEFFNVINQLMGDMPEDWVDSFVKSKGFALFQKVGEDPSSINHKTRTKFFNMINNELGSMPDEMLDSFTASPEFELYKRIGEIYGA